MKPMKASHFDSCEPINPSIHVGNKYKHTVDGCEINHPFGGPGFRNHPSYVEPRTNYQNNYAKHGQDSVLLISFNGCLGCLDAARKKKVFAWISDDIIDSYQIKYQPIVDQLFLYLYQH